MGLQYNLHYKPKIMITTLALEAETEIAYLLCLGETPPFCIIE